MTRDEVLEMARQAGCVPVVHGGITAVWWSVDVDELERFAALVAERTREECARVCEGYAESHAKDDDDSKARAWMMFQCSAAIRSMKAY